MQWQLFPRKQGSWKEGPQQKEINSTAKGKIERVELSRFNALQPHTTSAKELHHETLQHIKKWAQ
jgi:hypothetical protein